jgi:hypothetical protein
MERDKKIETAPTLIATGIYHKKGLLQFPLTLINMTSSSTIDDDDGEPALLAARNRAFGTPFDRPSSTSLRS